MLKKEIKRNYPIDWKEYTFDTLFDFDGGLPVSRANLSNKGICYLHYGDIHKLKENYIDVERDADIIPKYDVPLENLSENYILNDGDIAFADASEDYEGIGKSVVVLNKGNIPFISGLHVIVARDKTDLLNREFKRFFLSNWNIRKQMKRIATGISVLGINRPNLRKIDAVLPPLKEQQKIASILSTWDKAIELKEKLIEQKKEQKKGLIQNLLTGEVRLPGFDGDWMKKKIGDCIIESREIATDPILEKRLTVRLNLKGIEQREVNPIEKVGATTQYVRKAGQFIYGKQNLHKGAFGLIPEKFDGYQTSSDIPSFNFKRGIDSKWFFYYMSREGFYRNLERISTGTGSKRINPKDLYILNIKVPGINEQREIANVLSTIDKELELLNKELNNIKHQKKGLMQLLLTGKVRVKA
ncbi:restriction endonuclease subunit S [Lederbergia lenta]|uniref:Restriction modification system DNA specificity subunit n=1 Tax=Lederbergia lenta TaxID=1467 RepID=A0A2X4WG02_LEDLE|nr:restriction endonuclease subunit S [Lederbergia lenta]MEC2326210.1 restriction endonuclease subunit S [Lederbergia lenta]SQI63687.1 restriction modification system DNA specificity subunit [Lederbergia lenta]